MRVRGVPALVLGASALALIAAWWLLRTSPGALAEAERLAALEAAKRETALPAVASAVERTAVFVVDAQPIRRQPASDTAELAAVMAPIRAVVLAAEVDGRVVEVPVEEHDHVEKGTVLVRLERDFLLAAVERAEAALIGAEAAQKLSRLELERQQNLANRKVSSTADLDRAKSEERAGYAALQEARANLRDARARLEKAEIAAPFGGVVNALDLEPGAYVRPGEMIAELIDLSSIEIEVGVSDRQVVALHEGHRADIEVDAYPGELFEGEVVRVGRAADDETRKYPVVVRAANPEERLLPGMLGRVRFTVGTSEPVIRIPRRSVQSEFDLDYVWVLVGDGDVATVRRRRVRARPVPFRPDLVEVSDGVREGERVATSGIRQLQDGMVVRVKGVDS